MSRASAAYLFEKALEMERAAEPERQRIQAHAADCFGAYECQSCGCDRRGKWSDGPRACVSHQGNPAHLGYLAERTAKAQERIAAALEGGEGNE